MIDLLTAIGCSACVSMVMRWSEGYVQDKTGILAVNYMICSLCALLCCSAIGFDAPSFACGALMGVLLVAGLILLQYNIHRHGMIVPSLYTRLGVIVPILFSIVLFDERPAMIQLLGIALAIVSIIFLNSRKGEKGIGWSLILLLAANGTCDAMNKVYETAGSPVYSGQFLMIAFVCAMLLSLFMLLTGNGRIGKREALAGVLLGIPNYFSSRFLLYSLQTLDAIIVYPMYSVLTVIVITLLGMGIWHERITKRTALGMLLILLSVAFMNVR